MARKKSQEEIIAIALSRHQSYYSYSNAVYVDSKTKMSVTCPIHGDFLISPNNHLSGKGCSKCGDLRTAFSKQKDTSKFAKQVEERFPTKYSFDYTNYVSAREKVDVRCLKHDSIFSITPDNLLRGKGCPLCGTESRVAARKEMIDETVEEQELKFQEDILKVHNGRYKYLGGYRTKESFVRFLCEEHGEFEQRALVHLGGSGCQKCAENGFNPAKAGYVYVMFDGNLSKVGITNRKAKVRLRQIKRSSQKDFVVVNSHFFENGQAARDIETQLLRELRPTHKQPTEKFDGSTECFLSVDLPTLLSRIETLVAEHSPQ